MQLRKWNYKNHTYESYCIPDAWNCKVYSEDMNEVITCPHCGEPLLYGDSFTSIEIHTEAGIGYMVCGKCYFQEVERREKYEHTI